MELGTKREIICYLSDSIAQDSERLSLLPLSRDFLEALELSTFIKEPDTREKVVTFCELVLFHSSKFTAEDLFKEDLKARDILQQEQMKKMRL